MAEFDVHIKGGTVVDGTRVPRFQADVWIKDGKIAQVGGRVAGGAKKVIDADGTDRCPRVLLTCIPITTHRFAGTPGVRFPAGTA